MMMMMIEEEEEEEGKIRERWRTKIRSGTRRIKKAKSNI
jgi:hypothetical protein